MAEMQFNPLQWPPNIQLARLHYDCVKPGIDNTEGNRCPCCQRSEKLANNKWALRDITKDFGKFGGGIPGYFYLLIYIMVFFLIHLGVSVIYHIMMLNQACPTLDGTPQRCALVFGVFWNCDARILYNALVAMGNPSQADTLQYLQLATYIILVIGTIGIKVFLHIIGQKSSLDATLYSPFALIIKNVPLYYQLEDIKVELAKMVPGLTVAEMFYLHKTCEYNNCLKRLMDLNFEMKQVEQTMDDGDEKAAKQYLKLKEQYLKLYDKYEKEASNLKASSKKIIVVFNTVTEKEIVHKRLKMSELVKFWYYFTKLLGCKSEAIGYYSERIAEPQQIYWNYIGESSTHKQKVRIQTTLIGIGLVVIVFLVLYFPLLKIDQEKIYDPLIGTVLGMVISFFILVMVIIYRVIIGALMPTRRPSSKLAEGYFVVIGLSIFFFFFYLASPAVFFQVSPNIPDNFKLATFFMNIIIFCCSNIALNIIDVGYRTYNGKKNRLLTQTNEANKFCQGRVHEQLTPLPFPLAFKLVVAFNMWSFSSYYVFNIPYLLFFFFGVIFIHFWIDKYILYNRYKTNQYLSLELEHQAQKVVLVIFLICVSVGYLTIAIYQWEKWLILIVFITALIINFVLQIFFKKQKEEVKRHHTNDNLKATIEKCKSDVQTALYFANRQNQLKSSFVFNDINNQAKEISEASLASAVVMYGYKQTYDLYLNQFHRKEVHDLIENRYFSIKKSHSMMSAKSRESELAKMNTNTLRQKLIDPVIKEESQLSETSYKPPVISVSQPLAQKPDHQVESKEQEQIVGKEEGNNVEVKEQEEVVLKPSAQPKEE